MSDQQAEVPADPREPLGRLVHDQRLAHEADQAAAEGRTRFFLGTWEERSEAQRKLDMRIGHAVANYALEQNALTWNTDCNGCAGLLDRAYEEHVRAERAKAALDAARAALARHQHKITDSQGTICAGCLRDWPCPDIRAVEAALEAFGGETQERSDEEGATP